MPDIIDVDDDDPTLVLQAAMGCLMMPVVVSRAIAAGVVLGVVTMSQGCSVDSADDTPSAQCSQRSFDLRTPPTRGDLQMREGKGSTTWSCDEGFDTRADLPDDTTVSMPSRQVFIDSLDAAESGTPTSIDVHSTDLGVEAAASLAEGLATELRIDASELTHWSVEAEDSETSADVKTTLMESRVRFVLAQLQVVHQGVSGNNYVHLTLSWKA